VLFFHNNVAIDVCDADNETTFPYKNYETDYLKGMKLNCAKNVTSRTVRKNNQAFLSTVINMILNVSRSFNLLRNLCNILENSPSSFIRSLSLIKLSWYFGLKMRLVHLTGCTGKTLPKTGNKDFIKCNCSDRRVARKVQEITKASRL